MTVNTSNLTKWIMLTVRVQPIRRERYNKYVNMMRLLYFPTLELELQMRLLYFPTLELELQSWKM